MLPKFTLPLGRGVCNISYAKAALYVEEKGTIDETGYSLDNLVDYLDNQKVRPSSAQPKELFRHNMSQTDNQADFPDTEVDNIAELVLPKCN